jgi:hypothetical protein
MLRDGQMNILVELELLFCMVPEEEAYIFFNLFGSTVCKNVNFCSENITSVLIANCKCIKNLKTKKSKKLFSQIRNYQVPVSFVRYRAYLSSPV